MSANSFPERSQWAVRTLAVDPSDQLLEIGCGRGVAVQLICTELVGGTITAIDRSTTMVKLAEKRNQHNVAAGKAIIKAMALEEFDPGPKRFNKIFAINVSLFWLRPTSGELHRVRNALTSDGTLYLFYEQPGATRTGEIAAKLTTVLSHHGLAPTSVMTMTRRSTPMLCVLGRLNPAEDMRPTQA